ncbi:hypothetical protein CASFOL_037106 [Castilleja foliolosa]|uniref:Uncharacterized protein n=1 Tax=Castilleja foliolosa TaxID=1961234 RepID=A0ABD3BN27_9LAMI
MARFLRWRLGITQPLRRRLGRRRGLARRRGQTWTPVNY